MPPHHQAMPLRQALTRSLAEEGGAVRAVAYDPDARSFEAFGFGERGTHLLDALEATTLDAALAEVTEREHFGRGDRIGVREIGEGIDRLFVYAVRQTNTVKSWRKAYDNPYASTPAVYKCRLDHICTVDLRVIAGEFTYFHENPSLMEIRGREHRERQARRPEGARR